MVRKLRIGVILQSPDMGGAETLIYLLAKELNKRGNTIFLVTDNDVLATRCKGFIKERWNIPFVLDFIGNYKGLIKSLLTLPYLMFFYVKLLKKLKKNKVDTLLISGFSEKLFISFLTLFIKIPVVWTEHGPLNTIFPRNFGLPGLLYKWTYNIPKKILVPSRLSYESLVNDLGIPKPQVKLIRLGVYVPSMSLSTKRNKNKFVIGSVSRLDKEKGQEYLIKAMPKVLEKVPNAHLILVGNGPAIIHYKSLISDLKLENHVEITGYVKRIDEFYARFDIFVFPSIWELEGFGFVAVEAMARKLPLIASNIGPVSEMVVEGKSGFLVDPKDTNELASKIIKLAHFRKLRVKFGIYGYNRVKDLFDIRKTVQEYKKVLSSSI